MATNRILEREHEVGVQVESTYGTDPGAVSAGDIFKCSLAADAIGYRISRYDRDQDRDYQQPSVLSTQAGRKMTEVSIAGDVIPSGNSSTPTPPDMWPLFKHLFGTETTATAHTTTTAGSSGTSLVLTAGGGASSGIAAGDMIAVDVDATYGYEVRQVVSISTDTVTMDRALSTDPATGRTVKVGTTYAFSASALPGLSLYLKRFLGGTVRRTAVPGLILPQMELSIDFAADSPIGKVNWTGMGKAEVAHADSRPTPTTAGQPLAPTKGYAYFATTKLCLAGSLSLSVNNGMELRQNESCSLEPTGVKLTGNNSRYMVEMAMQMLATTGDTDTYAIYDAVKAFTTQDVIVQLGVTPGYIVAWRCPAYLPEVDESATDGEVSLSFSGGRCYGSAGDDDVTLAFI